MFHRFATSDDEPLCECFECYHVWEFRRRAIHLTTGFTCPECGALPDAIEVYGEND